MKFKQQIEDLFGEVSEYSEYKDKVRFKISDGFTADKLFKLSDILGTGTIDINSYYISGGCDTCDYGEETGMEFNAFGVKYD